MVFPFLKLVTDLEIHTRVLQWTADTPLSGLLQEHQRAVLVVGLGIMLIYVFRGWLSARLVRYQADVTARINSVASEQLVDDAPVSYTHLDVYKRQHPHSSRQSPARRRQVHRHQLDPVPEGGAAVRAGVSARG